MKGWSVPQVWEASLSYLVEAKVPEPELSIQHLLADVLDLDWAGCGFRTIPHEHGNTLLTEVQAQEYSKKLRRRQDQEPLQYILGQWDFLDYTVKIRPPLLCPRPETEELVMLVVEDTTESPIHILDVGCGTGVIGISLAEKLPDAFVQAIDLEPVAITTSLENADRILGDEDRSSYQAKLCAAQEYDPDHPFDIVVSNPPYIPRADMAGLSEDVVKYEDDQALCGGEDGMDVIRTIVHQLPKWCHSGSTCWMEVDPTHPKLLQDWLDAEHEALGVAFEATYQDMFGKDRFVKLRVL